MEASMEEQRKKGIMTDIKNLDERATAFLDKFQKQCMDLAEDLCLAGIPPANERWTMPVSIEEYNEALATGWPTINSVRFVVQSQPNKNVTNDTCVTCKFFSSTMLHDSGLSIGKRLVVPPFDYPSFRCHRYPKSAKVAPDYWCGEHKKGKAS